MTDLSAVNRETPADGVRARRLFRKIAAVSGVILVGGVPLCFGAPLLWGALLGTLGLFLGRAFLGPLVPAWTNDRLPSSAIGLLNLGIFCGLAGWIQAISGFSIPGSAFFWVAACVFFVPLFPHDRRRR